MLEPETFPQRIARIQHDQNISEEAAIRIAKIEINLETAIQNKN